MEHSRSDLERYLALLQYELALVEAEESLIRFAEVTMPVERFMDDPSKSKYLTAEHHRFMAKLMEKVDMGELRKSIINTAPRHGKSEICTRRFAAWYSGRHPDRDIIVATYGSDFAKDFGGEVRDIIRSQRFQQIFPEYRLDKVASDHMTNIHGGNLYFLGRRSPVNGRGGDLIIVDDPTKDDKEAGSADFREDCWQWFTQTLLTRRHTDKSAIVLTQCMTGDTPVLMPDGSNTPLSDIRAGDVVATYDNGRLSTAKVTKWSNQGPDKIFAVTMRSGQVVRANARHPFLVENDGYLEWRRMDTLRPGENILRVTTENGKALPAKQKVVTSPQSARVSAIPTTTKTDGRGAFARLRAILEAAATHICDRGTELTLWITSASKPNKAACARSAIAHPMPGGHRTTGGKNSASITAMILARFAGFSATSATSSCEAQMTLKSFQRQPNTSDFTPEKIVSIEPDGIEDVFDVTVERTENFIANGLVSHNTRWHEDDIVGRLTDPSNPAYSEKLRDGFNVFNIAAIAEEDDPMGREPGEPLWPERFGLEYLEEMREANARAFAALYMSNPVPDSGVFYQTSGIFEYELSELPERLTMYCASDHAVATKNINDRTCLIPYGVCERGDAWILPDVIWDRIKSYDAVESVIDMIKRHKPVFWYAEKGQIQKSIGPFIDKRMQEEGVYVPFILHPNVSDKVQFAHSARARCAQGRIRFPKWAPWWQNAKTEMLKFPNARFDDFVDTVSVIGMRMNQHTGPGANLVKTGPAEGTFGALKEQFKRQDREDKSRKARAGW